MVRVIEGASGYLFLGGNDSNNIISQHTGLTETREILPNIRFSHLARRNCLKEIYNSQYLHIISPNKETIAKDLMPPDVVYEAYGPTPVNAYFRAFPQVSEYTFFEPSTLADFHTERLYYLTDTHWTFKGAKRYLEAALEYAGLIQRRDMLRDMPLRVDDLPFVGDLAAHIQHPGEVQQHVLPLYPNAERVFFNDLATEGRVFHFVNPRRADRLLMIIDSTGGWALNFMAEMFNEVLAVHTADLDMSVLASYRPDFVIAMQCERFFVRSPRDGSNWRQMIAENEGRKNASRGAIDYLVDKNYMVRCG